MSEEPLSYIITSDLPEELSRRIWDIKTRYDLYIKQERAYKDSVITLNGAHITLKRRFYLSEQVGEVELVNSLDQVEKNRISLSAGSLDVYKSETFGNVVVALVDRNDVLSKLHDTIVKAVEPYSNTYNDYEGVNFHPHISITYQTPDEKLDEIMDFVRSHLLPIEYTLDNLNLLQNIQDVKLERRIVKRYRF